MNIKELLRLRGLDVTGRIKLVRHLDKKRYDVHEMYRSSWLETYQSYQCKPIFKGCDSIVVFLGLPGSQAVFVGVYAIKGQKRGLEVPISTSCPYDMPIGSNDVFYILERLPGFEDLQDRVVIEWGGAALAWHQWLSEKEVVEILPKGYVREFPGYLSFTLRYDELRDIVGNPDANREWHRALSHVAGIYLILDEETGKQYVGAAYGVGGVIGRWAQYARCADGGNRQLKLLLSTDKDYGRHFKFSLLSILPKTTSKEEALALETQFKQKLGARAFGLCEN